MNEFTKEELEWLLENILFDIEECSMPKIAYLIRDKLKSMIEDKDHDFFSIQKSFREINKRLDKLEKNNEPTSTELAQQKHCPICKNPQYSAMVCTCVFDGKGWQ